jgi:uncharacterized membrane protein
MVYNIHPIFVHFPIALLLVYSIIKIFPLKRWLPLVSWVHIENVLLFFGVISAFVSSSTGELAESFGSPNRQLVEMHSTFAAISTWIYGLLLVGVIIPFIMPYVEKLGVIWINNIFKFVHKILSHSLLSKVLALLGLIAISVTGLLGGVIVYGITADPVAPIILKILGISY